jgi:hypothetical protein
LKVCFSAPINNAAAAFGTVRVARKPIKADKWINRIECGNHFGVHMEEIVTLEIPIDAVLLAAVGRCTLTSEHLTYILRMTWMKVKDLHVDEALLKTKRYPAVRLRKEILEAAFERFGAEPEYSQLNALLGRCSQAADRRNDLIHSVCMKKLDGDHGRRTGEHHWASFPTVTELDDLTTELDCLWKELNYERLEGYLADVLARTEKNHRA